MHKLLREGPREFYEFSTQNERAYFKTYKSEISAQFNKSSGPFLWMTHHDVLSQIFFCFHFGGFYRVSSQCLQLHFIVISQKIESFFAYLLRQQGLIILGSGLVINRFHWQYFNLNIINKQSVCCFCVISIIHKMLEDFCRVELKFWICRL